MNLLVHEGRVDMLGMWLAEGLDRYKNAAVKKMRKRLTKAVKMKRPGSILRTARMEMGAKRGKEKKKQQVSVAVASSRKSRGAFRGGVKQGRSRNAPHAEGKNMPDGMANRRAFLGFIPKHHALEPTSNSRGTRPERLKEKVRKVEPRARGRVQDPPCFERESGSNKYRGVN